MTPFMSTRTLADLEQRCAHTGASDEASSLIMYELDLSPAQNRDRVLAKPSNFAEHASRPSSCIYNAVWHHTVAPMTASALSSSRTYNPTAIPGNVVRLQTSQQSPVSWRFQASQPGILPMEVTGAGANQVLFTNRDIRPCGSSSRKTDLD